MASQWKFTSQYQITFLIRSNFKLFRFLSYNTIIIFMFNLNSPIPLIIYFKPFNIQFANPCFIIQSTKQIRGSYTTLKIKSKLVQLFLLIFFGGGTHCGPGHLLGLIKNVTRLVRNAAETFRRFIGIT